jgi:hypothetical protein
MDVNDSAAMRSRTWHQLRMSGRGVFYSFSFDLGPGLDIVRLANRLLKKDMATVAASPSRQGLSLARRAVELDRQERDAAQLAAFLEVIGSGGGRWRGLFRASRRHTLRLIWTERKRLARIYSRRILLGHRVNGPISRQRQPAPPAPAWIQGSQQQLGEVISGLGRLMTDRHLIDVARLRLEQQLYLPGYFENIEPFIRIAMNRTYYSDESHEDEPIEISLMAHRSGICMLTFATPIAKNFGLEDGYKYLQAREREFRKVEVPTVIARPPRRHPSSIESDFILYQTSHSGLDWTVAAVPHGDNVRAISLVTIFTMYRSAIEKMAGRDMRGEWYCNTTLFQGTPSCGCVGVEAKERHSVEFAQLMIRSRSDMPVQDSIRDDLLKNYLVNSDEELWLSAGHAIHTLWEVDRVDYLRDLRIIEPIESAVVQHRQLQAIDRRTVNTHVRDYDLFAAQDQLAVGLPEYGRNLIADLNAPLVVEGLATKLKTPDLYSRLNDRVKVLESIVNTRYARKQSRRSTSISIIGLVIVVLLLLPRIDEFISKLGKLTPTRTFASALTDLFGTTDRTTFGIYAIAVVATVTFFMVATIRLPLSRLRRRKRNFGYATRHDIEVTIGSPRTTSLPGGIESSSTGDVVPTAPIPKA